MIRYIPPRAATWALTIAKISAIKDCTKLLKPPACRKKYIIFSVGTEIGKSNDVDKITSLRLDVSRIRKKFRLPRYLSRKKT